MYTLGAGLRRFAGLPAAAARVGGGGAGRTAVLPDLRSSLRIMGFCFSKEPPPPIDKMEAIEDYVVCKDEDIRDGEMKELDLGDTGSKCLLVKEEGRISAFSNKCTHYGAPLVNGK